MGWPSAMGRGRGVRTGADGRAGTAAAPSGAAQASAGGAVDERRVRRSGGRKAPSGALIVPDEVVGHGLSRLIPDSAADVATWLDARDPVRGGDLTRRLCAVPGLREALRLEERAGGRAPEQPHRGGADQPGQQAPGHTERHFPEPLDNQSPGVSLRALTGYLYRRRPAYYLHGGVIGAAFQARADAPRSRAVGVRPGNRA
jgi:hypothetical protein